MVSLAVPFFIFFYYLLSYFLNRAILICRFAVRYDYRWPFQPQVEELLGGYK
jgi:hypothetical protein